LPVDDGPRCCRRRIDGRVFHFDNEPVSSRSATARIDHPRAPSRTTITSTARRRSSSLRETECRWSETMFSMIMEVGSSSSGHLLLLSSTTQIDYAPGTSRRGISLAGANPLIRNNIMSRLSAGISCAQGATPLIECNNIYSTVYHIATNAPTRPASTETFLWTRSSAGRGTRSTTAFRATRRVRRGTTRTATTAGRSWRRA
jgi:hypothetical protein